MGTNQPSSPLSYKSESTTSSIQLRTLTSIPTGYNARIEEEHHSSEGKSFSTWPKLNYNIDINNINDNGNNDSDKYSFDSSSSSQDQKIKSSSNQLKRSNTIGTLINMKKNTLSHKKSLSHHINSSLSRRSDSIHQAAQRFSTMILGTNMDEENRLIVIDPDSKNPLIDPRTKKPFITNFITTSRYNICTFLPKQLYAQFSKVANIYFLFVAILQTIPNYSPTGQFTTIIPLSVFIIIAMAHEGFDDYRRHKHDNVENNKEESKWKNLKVGDFVSVKAQEWIPADILLLHSKGENGICYVETSALDGETNLKQRQALKATNSLLSSPESLANFKAKVKTENPNQDLYNFDGSIELPDGSTHPLTNNQILLRGTILRNTPEIYGVIIFTGEETKLRMNASKNIRTKAPTCTISSVLWDNGIGGNLWYMGETPKQIQVILFGFIILYNTMIPISLYVTMEVTKLVQAYLINNDLAMYHEENIRKIEEEEILKMAMKKKFSIRNQKSKKRISLASITRHFRKQQDQQSNDFIDANNNENGEMALDDFGSDCNSSNISLQRTDSMAVISNSVKHKNSLKRHDSRHSETFSMIAPAVTEPSPFNGDGNNNNTDMENSFDENIRSTLGLLAILQHQPNTAFGKKAKFFLLAIALCHTCVPEIDEETKDVFYQASSPDEFALVTAAKELGYVVIDRTMSSVSLRINHGDPNDTNIYNINANIITMTPTSIHSMNNFATSSVPVIPEDSPISINHHDHREGSYCFKTTDSDYSIMDSFPIQDETWLHSQTMYHIQDFATEGLRTLLYALFQYYVGFSGTSLYESWTLSFYNTLFSSLPVLVIGIFEKDLNQETLLGFPQLYTIGQRNGAFNLKLFFSWMCGAIYNAFVIVLIPFFLHGRDVRGTGSPQLYELGLIVYTCVVFVVTIKIAYLECHNWTIITHITSFITIFGWFLYQTVYSYIYPNNFHSTPYEVNGVFRKVSVRTEFWTTVSLIIFFAIVPIMVVKVFKSIILPTDVDIYQEIEKDKRLLEELMNENESSDDNNNVGEMVNDNSQKKTKDI
ncbi:14311_t:CDS:2 [Entrophospora sp. SA101]|nr:14311_t:CDS:2 [Entrophospora sp. SA101]